jgi:hypothetical protein
VLVIAPANGRVPLELVEGLVEAVNDNGIKVKGEWLNRSQYGQPLELPAKGAYVRAQVDARGYLKSLDVVGAAPIHDSIIRSDAREERIARLAVLKAAAAFLGALSQTREDIKAHHVLVLAEKWLAWVGEE